jgi:hypothetical protein
MRIYNTVNEYEKNAKIGDYITFEGHGIVNGLKNSKSKHDFYKISKINHISGAVSFKEYRCKTSLTIMPHMKNQKVLSIIKKEFQDLPTLW